MFGLRYFPKRFFPGRYFPPLGITFADAYAADYLEVPAVDRWPAVEAVDRWPTVPAVDRVLEVQP
jgi:hypothetical protein